MIETQEAWILTFRAANILKLALDGELEIKCVENGNYFEENNAGNVSFLVGKHIFEVFCDVGEFDYIDRITFDTGEVLECDSPFPDDVVGHVLGKSSYQNLVSLFLNAAKADRVNWDDIIE